jgi:chromosomal replication initiator protein
MSSSDLGEGGFNKDRKDIEGHRMTGQALRHDEQISKSDQQIAEVWQRVRHRLRKEVGDNTFKSWFRGLEFENVSDGRAMMAMRSRFIRNWILSNHADRLTRIWRDEDPTVSSIDIVFRARTDTRLATEEPTSNAAFQSSVQVQANDGAHEAPAASAANRRRATGNGFDAAQFDAAQFDPSRWNRFDPRYTFENFVVGKPNELAYAAAQRVATTDDVAFNPLYLYGGVGLGKTHLLHAIGIEVLRRNPSRKVMYLTAETFMNEFVSALRFKDTLSFKTLFRNVDVLLVDDVQFIAKKGTTQEEFFHTFNALVENKKQIVISADRSPTDLDDIEDRIKSRLGWGLPADIHPTDFELRLGILKVKAEAEQRRHPGLAIPDAVLEFLADRIDTNVRELEGALTRVVAKASLIGAPVGLEMAKTLLRDLLRSVDRKVTIDEIQRKVADFYKIRMSDMMSARRGRGVARPRQIAMYLAKNLTTKSYPEIGRKFGGRDHTTVMYAVRRVDSLRESDRPLDEDVDLLTSMLEN